jgi:hypothetical protein
MQLNSIKSTYTATDKLWRQTVQNVLAQLKDSFGQPIKIAPEWEGPFYSQARHVLGMGGEGSGKSFCGGLFATCKSVFDSMRGTKLYWVIGADFEDARKDFSYLVDFQQQLDNIQSLHMPSHHEKQCILVTRTGQTFVTISAYDSTKIAREEPDGIVGAEVSRWYQETYDRAIGRLARNYPHSWGFFTGSFESSLGWLPDLFKIGEGPNDRELRSYSIPTWANLSKFPQGRDSPAIIMLANTTSVQRFQERYGGRPAPPRSVVFSEFRVPLHVDHELVPDPNLPTYVAIDPGGQVYAVLFVQMADNGEVCIVDEIYVHRWTHDQVINEFKMRPASALVTGGAIDVAARQAHMGMPVPIEEWYRDTGLSLWAQKQPVDESIERVRMALSHNPTTGRPRLRIHPSCKGLISELGGGVSPVEGGGPWMYFETAAGLGPPRKENDHACKALAYLLGGPYGFLSSQRSMSTETYSYLTRRTDASSRPSQALIIP